jgi:hypothetical protein
MINEEMATRFRERVETWRGATAWLWSYSVTHSELHIRLVRPGTDENLHVICAGCRRISAPNAWRASAIELVFRPDDDQACCVVQDIAAGLRVECTIVYADGNVSPLLPC